MTELPAPLPCPFCAAAKGHTIYQRDDVSVCVVVCEECNAQGPVVRGTAREAVEAWNRRERGN